MFCDTKRLGLTHRVRTADDIECMEDWDATILYDLVRIRRSVERINESLYWHDSSFHDVDELYQLKPAVDDAIAGYVEQRLYHWIAEVEPEEQQDEEER